MMDREEFLEKMISHFGGKKESSIKKYSDGLEIFCNKCPDIHYEEIFNYSIALQKKPTVKKLFKYAEDQEFIPLQEKKVVKNLCWRRCQEQDEHDEYCNTDYSLLSGGCPICKGKKGIVVNGKGYESYPESYHQVQVDCHKCKLYRTDISGNKYTIDRNDDGFRVEGPGCNDYGKPFFPNNQPVCEECRCNDCCKLMSEYNNTPYSFGVKARAGNINMNWLEA